jgi:hypothetical protein
VDEIAEKKSLTIAKVDNIITNLETAFYDHPVVASSLP